MKKEKRVADVFVAWRNSFFCLLTPGETLSDVPRTSGAGGGRHRRSSQGGLTHVHRRQNAVQQHRHQTQTAACKFKPEFLRKS